MNYTNNKTGEKVLAIQYCELSSVYLIEDFVGANTIRILPGVNDNTPQYWETREFGVMVKYRWYFKDLKGFKSYSDAVFRKNYTLIQLRVE